MFTRRKLEDADYSMLQEWWKWHRFSAPPKEFMPEEGRGGILVGKDGVPICAGFVFFTNSRFVWIEYVVSNPEYRQKDRHDAIQYLIKELCDMTRYQGGGVAYTNLKNPHLIKHFEACGFGKGSTGTTEMVKVLL